MIQTTFQSVRPNLTEIEQKHAPSQILFEGDTSLLTKGRRITLAGFKKSSDEYLRKSAELLDELVSNDISLVIKTQIGLDYTLCKWIIENGGKVIDILSSNTVHSRSDKKVAQTTDQDCLVIYPFEASQTSELEGSIVQKYMMAIISDAIVIIDIEEINGLKSLAWEGLRLGRRVFITQSVIEKSSLSWITEALAYGAEILTEENCKDLIMDIPYLTSRCVVQFH